jgi:hypothetical protein
LKQISEAPQDRAEGETMPDYQDNYDNEGTIEIISPGMTEALERAQVDMQIATAKKYPRSIGQFKAKMLAAATVDQETAQACFYSLSRTNADGDQKPIEGPSVRLAEIAVSCYGNVRAASRITDNDGKSITAQGVCYDLENNVCVSMEVRRSIMTKKGKTFGQDMQNVTANAAAAIAFRNAVFKTIPAAYIKEAYTAAKKAAIGVGPIEIRFEKAVRQFAGFRVTQVQILKYLGKTAPKDITDEDIGKLLGTFNSLRDGEATVNSVFGDTSAPPQQTADERTEASQKHEERIKQAAAENRKAEANQVNHETETAQSETDSDKSEMKNSATSEKVDTQEARSLDERAPNRFSGFGKRNK